MLEELHQEIKKLKLVGLGIIALTLGVTLFWVSVSYVNGLNSALTNPVALAVNSQSEPEPENTAATGTEQQLETEDRSTENQPDPQTEIETSIQAQAVAVYDLTQDRILYELAAEESRPLASLTKLMTTLIAAEQLPYGTSFIIEPKFLPAEGPHFLQTGDRWRMKDLIDLALIESNNDAASVIGHQIGLMLREEPTDDPDRNLNTFIDVMNERARQIGLRQTSFFNATGLDTNEIDAGSYGSASDINQLMAYISYEHPELLAPTTELTIERQSLNGSYRLAKNTNQQIKQIPRLIGSKTGYTDLAGGNLSVLYEPRIGRPVAITVLGSGLNSRFSDVLKIAEIINEYYEHFD